MAMCRKCWTVPCICDPEALHLQRERELAALRYDPVAEAERYLRAAAEK